MTAAAPTLAHDWYPRPLPPNVQLGERTFLHSAHAFVHCASRRPVAVAVGDDSGVYHGCHFDLGPEGVVRIGRFCTVVGAVFATNGTVRVGDHTFIAHEVLIADDAWAVPPGGPGEGDPDHALRHINAAARAPRLRARIDIGADVWIGARATILGPARIGAGASVAAGAVVTGDVPAGSTVAGNPAQVVRRGPWPA
jgi:acetyltransferase-like isoleucine patch superfamily enzyme